jgi:hypothetical protein
MEIAGAPRSGFKLFPLALRAYRSNPPDVPRTPKIGQGSGDAFGLAILPSLAATHSSNSKRPWNGVQKWRSG